MGEHVSQDVGGDLKQSLIVVFDVVELRRINDLNESGEELRPEQERNTALLQDAKDQMKVRGAAST